MCNQQPIDTVERVIKTHENNIQQRRDVAVSFEEFIGIIDQVDSDSIDQHQQARKDHSGLTIQ